MFVKLDRWWKSHVVVGSILFFLISMPLVWGAIFPILQGLDKVWQGAIKYGLSALWAWLVIQYIWQGEKLLGMQSPFWKGLFSFGLLGVIGAIGAFFFSRDTVDMMPSVMTLLGCILMNLAIAVSEEFIFRIVILNYMLKAWQDKKQVLLYALIICNMIFGLRHLLNLITMPQAVYLTLAQVVFTFMAGLYLCAVYLRTRNIWICILIHFMEDFGTSVWEIFSSSTSLSASADGNIFAALGMIALQIPYVIFAILMMRDKNWHFNGKSTINAESTVYREGIVE